MRLIILFLILAMFSFNALALEPEKLRLNSIYVDDPASHPEMYVRITVENELVDDLEEMRVYVIIPELDEYAISGAFTDDDDTVSSSVVVDLPPYVKPGWYVVKITVSNDKIRRSVYREVYIG